MDRIVKWSHLSEAVLGFGQAALDHSLQYAEHTFFCLCSLVVKPFKFSSDFHVDSLEERPDLFLIVLADLFFSQSNHLFDRYRQLFLQL